MNIINKFTIAAPSCVWPARVPANCARLAGKVTEVGIYLMESQACMRYGQEDLPASLATLPLSYHLHLPVDLPWRGGVGAIEPILSGLFAKTAFLKPQRYVLHPPSSPTAVDTLAQTAAMLRRLGVPLLQVCVESIPGNDLADLWQVIIDEGFGVCVDLGHLLAFGQHRLLDLPGLAQRLAMLHLHAPELAPAPRDAHLPVTSLNPEGRMILERLLAMARPDATLVAEVFSPTALAECLAGIHDVLQLNRASQSPWAGNR